MLKDISVLFGLALLTVVLFRKLQLPSIIGFLVTGIMTGPYALAIIGNPHEVEQMTEKKVSPNDLSDQRDLKRDCRLGGCLT